jgi:2',3'-cyclic-nucleotide 2'-phosphodiesterase/3'-nucleotidase
VLSIAAPFNRQASFPSGQVTVRDVTGLYIYDNTLLGVRVTGQQLRDYLEYSMQYFQQVTGTGPFTMDQVTNAVTANAPNGTPDYNFDSIAGLDAPLTYDVDIAQPVGSRSRTSATTAARSPRTPSSRWPRRSSTTGRSTSGSC